MKLLTKKVIKDAVGQYDSGSNMEQMVVAKFFDPVGSWKWYLMNMADDTGSYAWGIVKGVAVEMGSFSVVELMEYKSAWGLGIERDIYWEPMKAKDVFESLTKGDYV